jgi:F-type H+-transporting ATPase subunit delta
MSELTVANRYAKSLIDLAVENKSLEETKKDMELFTHTLRVNHELQAILANPIIPQQKKKNILTSIFGGKVSKISESFFNIMIDKSRSEILYATAKEFANQYNIIKNIVKATVVSATPLSDDNRKKIVAELQQATGGTIELHTRVDAKLIGGFVLTVGDRQVDTSLSSSLNRLKQDFTRGINR